MLHINLYALNVIGTFRRCPIQRNIILIQFNLCVRINFRFDSVYCLPCMFCDTRLLLYTVHTNRSNCQTTHEKMS